MEPGPKYGIVFASGLLTLVLGVVLGWYGFPTIIDNMIEEQMVLTNDSDSFDPWREPTSQIDVFMQFIMFNVTNADEVKAGGKPVLEEVGPFSYKENRQRVNLTWSEDNTKLTYDEVITYVFDKESSADDVDEDTLIVTINAPMVVVAAMGDAHPLISGILTRIINNEEKGESFKSYKAGDLLLSGVEDDLMAYIAENFPQMLPPYYADGKFRLYGYNNTVDGPYEILTGKGDIDHFTFIQSYQGSSNLSYWSTYYCNMINGTDGITYPPNTGEVDRVFIFNKDLCRAIYLDYEKDIEYFGIPGRRFAPTREVLEDPEINEDNKCYCVDGKCLKAGALSLSPCQYGAPVVASTPHFYMGAEEYLNQTIGLSPDKDRHQTFVDIEPYTGLAMNGGKKIQINLQTKRYKKIQGLEAIPEILFPLIYTNETAIIDQASADELKSELMTPLKLLTAAQWVLVAVGAAIMVLAPLLFVRTRRKTTTV